MTKVKQNFEVWAGDTKNLVFTITGSDGAGYSLTGATIVWMMEEYPTSGSLIRKETSGSGITISTSTVTVALSPSDTLNYAGDYYHELEAVDSSSQVATLAIGALKIHKSGAEKWDTVQPPIFQI